jgi:hypothetical protein
MPIETTCPGCAKAYKLKDELAGKSVKCSNPDCRKVFPIPAAAANGKPAKPKAKSKKELEAEAEALAAELFGEQQEEKKAAERTLTVECVMCNHKWAEPESKAGKNVICPECKHRMKVPELKKKQTGDWRDASGGRRLLEKQPDLPKDLAEQQMQEVSITALKDAGAIEEPEVEARPLSFWVTLATVILVIVGGTAGAVYWFMKSGKEGKEADAMAEAMKGVEELKDAAHPVPEADRRLMRAGLHIAAGEFHARLNTKEGIKAATKEFAAARRELEAAPKPQQAHHERDALFADLAVAQLSLGGTEEQANSEVRLRWSQAGAKAPPVGGTVIDYVQTELRQTLTKFNEKEVDKGMRLSAVARITRELCKQGRPDILFEIVAQGFAPEDALEAKAFALLVASRFGGPEDKIKREAEMILDQLKADEKLAPWPAVALFDKFGLKLDRPLIPAPVEDRPAATVTRMAYAALYLGQDKLADAVKLASAPPGTAAERFPAMATIAELMADPKPLLEEAAKEVKSAQGGSRFHLYRLTRVAADAGAPDKAEAFAKAIPDEGLRELATAEALRGKWAAGKSVAAAGDLSLPTEPAKTKVGQAWAALLFARHNAKTTGDPAAAKQYDEWAEKKLRGFGYAGMALGLQDSK